MRSESKKTPRFSRALLAMMLLAGCSTEIADPPDPARISLAQGSAAFALVQGEPEPSPVSILVTNSGEAALGGITTSVEYVSGPTGGWLSASLSTTLAPAALQIATAASAMPAGDYEARVHVVAPTADNSPQAVSVTLTVTLPPEPARLGLSSRGLEFEMVEGGNDPAPRALTITNEGDLPLEDLSVDLHFIPGQATGWIDASVESAEAPTTLNVALVTDGLAPGSYGGTIFIHSEAASNSPESVTVFLTITAATPLMTVEPGQAQFVSTEGRGDPAAQSVWVRNGGLGALNDLSAVVAYPVGHPTGWLDASLSQTTAPALLTLSAKTGSLTPGTHEAAVIIQSPAAGNGPLTFDVTFVIRPPGPVIAVEPRYVSFNAARGGLAPPSQTVQITNADAGTLTDLSIDTGGAPWLTATLDQTTAPATVTIRVDPAGLAVDVYNGTIDVLSPVAENGYESAYVIFTVDTGLPDLTLAGPFSSPPSTPAGEVVHIDRVVHRNQGLERTASHRVGWYLSTDATIDARDILVRSLDVSGLEAGEERTLLVSQLTIPTDTPPGSYHLGVLVDPADAVFESDEGNNFVSAPFEIEPALTYYALTKIVSPEGAGVIDGAGVPNPALILEGEIPSLIPMAAPGWVFVSWGGDATGSDVPFDITMNADTTVIANFQPAPSPAAGSGGGWAALLPAWRASATDPAVALRSD